MLTDSKDAMIVRSVIKLGHNLGLTVVAEGIEAVEIKDALASLGCNEIQGYFICRPQPEGELNKWFAASPWEIISNKS
jgi:EAL domain-containing protein (putative c-di-GMP-specific phosphodiesterase class I)